ncbi:hypothetical protein CBS101457_004732 [Exobasidium rhododendri]|nr:hypothetical protein CBS101457_004732 [Exobasidium rhododendri]
MSSSSAAGLTFQAPPVDLKALSPFLQRAFETRTADPALSYWCNYHAAQLGIPLLSSLQHTSKSFLIDLMDTLESQKKALAGNDVVHGDDMVAKAYVENVALKVFAGADNEDRTGKANKGTARRFLVAANFIEVLGNFGSLESDVSSSKGGVEVRKWNLTLTRNECWMPMKLQQMEAKLKYSKWKAADIAKALREGRKPTPGAVDEEVEEVVDQANVEALTGTQEAAARLASLDAAHPIGEQEYIDREMAKLTAGESLQDATTRDPSYDSRDVVTAISSDEVKAHPGQVEMRRAQSTLSFDGEHSTEKSATLPDDVGGVTDNSTSPNFSRPLSIISPSPSLGESQGQNAFTQFSRSLSGTSSPNPRPLPLPPGSNNSSFRGREGLPIPPGGGNTNPLAPPPHLISPGLPPTPSAHDPSRSLLPSRPSLSTPSFPTAPPAPVPVTSNVASSTLPSASSRLADLPSSLDPIAISRVQKIARWAISALDYDDVETARKQLREALDICEGKTVVIGKK